MQLNWHTYRYYPYERDLALREASALLETSNLSDHDGGIAIKRYNEASAARHLTYFAGYANGHGHQSTIQHLLETGNGSSKNRQSTRYSVHGLHDYKGKFNPQIAKAILNIFDLKAGSRVLDPFCGSGTTLVECSHRGLSGFGTDINPLAVYLANAKLLALSTPTEQMRDVLKRLKASISRVKSWSVAMPENQRSTYLGAWFTPPVIELLEVLRVRIEKIAGPLSPIFLCLASNLLREYSLQDPQDLRIRRRTTPLPTEPFDVAFIEKVEVFIDRLEATKEVLGDLPRSGSATLADITQVSRGSLGGSFDAALTSPPYAMALPYIDTQRLSLVWLDLVPAEEILKLESELIGSRELRGQQRHKFSAEMEENASGIPDEQAAFCLELQGSLGESDGFRRKAVPLLLYRYFSAMRQSFTSIHKLLKRQAPFALIIGHNHTVLGGHRFDIDTPRHLASIAEMSGWQTQENNSFTNVPTLWVSHEECRRSGDIADITE